MDGSLLLAAALLAASATFSGAEAALFTLASRRDRRGARGGAMVARLLADQPGALAVILLLNLVVNLAFFASSQLWARELDAAAEAAAGLGAVVVIVIVGEILPKLLAHRFPLLLGRVLLPPVWLGHLLLAPVLRPFQRGWAAVQAGDPLDSGQTRDLLRADVRLEDAESVLLRQVLEMGQLRAGALRSPLNEVLRIDGAAPRAQALAELEAEGRAWGAVVDDDGEVVGILERLRAAAGATAADAMRPVPVLPEVAPVAAGVRLLRRTGAPFVLLVDEYGEAAGIIRRGRWADALLDRMPSGERPGTPVLRQHPDGGWRADAALPLHVFEDHFGFQPDSDVRVDTLGGLVAERMERVPQPGDVVRLVHEGLSCEITVVEASETRPLLLALDFEAAQPAGGDADGGGDAS